MNPAMIMVAIQAIESLTILVAKLIQDHPTMQDEDKQALVERIKQTQASVPEWI